MTKRLVTFEDEELDRLIEWYEHLVATSDNDEDDGVLVDKLRAARLK